MTHTIPTGTGIYPEYPALWHLVQSGVVSDLTSFASPAWDEAAQAATPRVVALIDTAVAWDHPNLRGAIDQALMRDFSVVDEGAFVLADTALSADDLARRQAVLAAMQPGVPGADTLLDAMRATAGQHDPALVAADPVFGAHGTAMAGLIGGRPVAGALLRRPDRHLPDGSVIAGADDPVALPYAGVHPLCRIVPIVTTGAPDPGMWRAAFAYADLIGADVVACASMLDFDASDPGWQAADTTIRAVGARRVILAAAGNDPTGLAYPASLRGQDRILAVAATTRDGVAAPYAPGGASFHALSGDSLSLDAAVVIYDPHARPDPAGAVLLPDQTVPRPMQLEDLVTTDVPGPFGYNPSPFPHVPGAALAGGMGDWHHEIGSLYARFSGTSAATALAAGLAALAMASTGPTPTPVAGAAPITLDGMRGLLASL
ncbi:S8 family serine peptidase [Gemmobacter denitrificans]|uniref:S8 family serine peptidase n=1 Tax=Gemmobacter denitrificans TaxID=3123040 RepID=A0ABU8BUD3_9RHOB